MARTVGSSGPRTLEAIHKAGLKLIHQHGYEAMSLRDLAAEVGIQQGSLYNHIENKQSLLFELVRNHLEHLTLSADAALKGIEGAEARLRAFVDFHVHYHMVRKAEVFVVNKELRSLEPQNYATIVKMRREYEARLASILEEGMAQGVFARLDTAVATYVFMAMLTGICDWYRDNGRLSKKQILKIYDQLVMHGLSKPATAQSLPDLNATKPTAPKPKAASPAKPARKPKGKQKAGVSR
jgi:AcrR family transcriptional regulator